MKKNISLTEEQVQNVLAKVVGRILKENNYKTKNKCKCADLNESEGYDQWKHEAKMFMDGLRNGQAIVDGDIAYVQVFKRATPKNDPRYVYIKKGDKRLHDDHYYLQNSPVLSKRTLTAIYKRLGWYDEEYIYEEKCKKPVNEGKANLLKQYENDTDFTICLYQMPNGVFVVTEYDFVKQKHKKIGEFKTFDTADEFAEKENEKFKI